MELRADDRERHVIAFLQPFKDINLKIERITVGDFAFIYKGRIIAVIERKTLADLAASIKDGRMNNHAKLSHASALTNCCIIYIIEGPQFPHLAKKFGRIPFKALQGKIDSLRFRHNSKIIWTKNCDHTANRLRGLFFTFTLMANQGVFGNFGDVKENEKKCKDIKDTKENDKKAMVDTTGGAIVALKPHLTANDIIKAKHVMPLDVLHIHMATQIKGITRQKAIVLLKVYNIQQLLLGQTDEKTCYDMVYPSGKMRFGPRGSALHKKLKNVNATEKNKILQCISGITLVTAATILTSVPFEDIVKNCFIKNAIADIQKTENRKMGNAMENKIRLAFSIPDIKKIFGNS
jgi:ERCC4-type nuclease